MLQKRVAQYDLFVDLCIILLQKHGTAISAAPCMLFYSVSSQLCHTF